MYGNSTGADLSAFPNAQMLYPAAGVMLAYLLTRQGDRNVPRLFYVTFLVITVLMILCALASVFMPQSIQAGQMEMSVWMALVQVVLILGSIIFWITLLVSGKERREACGLRWRNWKKSGFVYAFVLCALQPPHGDFLCPGRTDGRICPVVDPSLLPGSIWLH